MLASIKIIDKYTAYQHQYLYKLSWTCSMRRTGTASRDILSSGCCRQSCVQRLTSNCRRSISTIKPVSSTVLKSPPGAMATTLPEPAFGKLRSESPLNGQPGHKPFLMDNQTTASDWISELELDTTEEMARQDMLRTAQPLRILVLYGSLRKR